MWQAIAAGALLGGVAGSQPDQSSSMQSSMVNLRDIRSLNRGRSKLESTADASQLSQFNQLQDLLKLGPGAAEVKGGLQSQMDLASLIQSSLAQGGMPNQMQVGQAQDYASQIFNPQRVALQQSFADQDIAGQRLAARLGRSGADPVLRNKLAQEQTRQQSFLSAQQGAFAAEQAMGMPQRQLQLAEALAQVRGGLATQALQNRQTLLGLGQHLAESERNYRLQAAGRTVTGSTSAGGGTAGFISGALAGAGSGMRLAGAFGGGGPSAAPATGGSMSRAGYGDPRFIA